MSDAPILEVRRLEKEYPGVRALQGVDLDVRPGEVHCLLGPDGAGKSTLIECVSGVVEPTRGEILDGGEPLPVGAPGTSLKRGVATIYQELDLVVEVHVGGKRLPAGKPAAAIAAGLGLAPEDRKSLSRGETRRHPSRPGAWGPSGRFRR